MSEKIISLNCKKLLPVSIILMIIGLNGCSKREKTIRYTDSNHNEISLYTQSKGNGRPILFIHGNSFDHKIWEEQFKSEGLKNFKLISYDLRGHGNSVKFHDPDKSATEYSLKLHAEDLRKVIEYYKDDNLVVVGWSLGGNILLRYLLDYPDAKISKAVILGALSSSGLYSKKNVPLVGLNPSTGFLISGIWLSPDPEEKFIEMYIKASIGKTTDVTNLEEVSPHVLKKFTDTFKNTDGFSRIGLFDGLGDLIADLEDGKMDMPFEKYSMTNFYEFEMADSIERIKTPVRLLVSENDFWPVEKFTEMEKINPEFFSTKVTGKTGHAVFYSSPEIFEKELQEFIKE